MNQLIVENNILINYPDIDAIKWRNFSDELNKNLYKAIEDRIKYINISIYDNPCIKDINSYHYVHTLEDLYWFLLHINNPFIYNYYFNLIINIHKQNIYDFNNQIPIEEIKKTKKNSNTKQRKIANKYKLTVVRNIFTGETEYEYYNPVTEDKIISDNPNLLSELNTKKKKEKKVKSKVINMNNICISFANFKKNK